MTRDARPDCEARGAPPGTSAMSIRSWRHPGIAQAGVLDPCDDGRICGFPVATKVHVDFPCCGAGLKRMRAIRQRGQVRSHTKWRRRRPRRATALTWSSVSGPRERRMRRASSGSPSRGRICGAGPSARGCVGLGHAGEQGIDRGAVGFQESFPFGVISLELLGRRRALTVTWPSPRAG